MLTSSEWVSPTAISSLCCWWLCIRGCSFPISSISCSYPWQGGSLWPLWRDDNRKEKRGILAWGDFSPASWNRIKGPVFIPLFSPLPLIVKGNQIRLPMLCPRSRVTPRDSESVYLPTPSLVIRPLRYCFRCAIAMCVGWSPPLLFVGDKKEPPTAMTDG